MITLKSSNVFTFTPVHFALSCPHANMLANHALVMLK